jgi:hypothetical protein
VFERIHHGLVHHQSNGLFEIVRHTNLRGNLDGNRDLPFHGDAVPHASQRIVEGARRGGNRCRLQILDEKPQFLLLDCQRTLDCDEPLTRCLGRVSRSACGHGLQFQTDAGERLQQAVVQIARQPEACLAGGDTPQLSGCE